MPAEAWIAIVGIVLGVIAYLLDKKDRQQEQKLSEQQKQIDLLFVKHDQDDRRLSDFEIKIAENHYRKPELDTRFDRLEQSFREGMSELGRKFDRFAEALINGNSK